MAYPPPPWQLKGHALQTLQLVRTDRARRFVPDGLKIVSIFPGRTLGGVYFARYGPGSILEYNELIVAAALVRKGSRLGFWISHIYVDDQISMLGGREIWGLPKELASFEWQEGSVRAYQDRQLLCTLNSGKPRWLHKQTLLLPTLTAKNKHLLSFNGRIRHRFGLARARLRVAPDSPFASLGLGAARLSYHYGEMTFTTPQPINHGPFGSRLMP